MSFVGIYMSEDMKKKLEELAEINTRSLSKEIVHRLKQTFDSG